MATQQVEGQWMPARLRERIAKFGAGLEAGDLSHLQDNKNYKNYNLSSGEIINTQASSYSQTDKNYKNYKGLFAKIHSDALYGEVFEWAPDEEKTGRMLYACIRDYGELKVREAINRIKKLRDTYFREGQPVPPQRFKLFCFEMRKLQNQKGRN